MAMRAWAAARIVALTGIVAVAAGCTPASGAAVPSPASSHVPAATPSSPPAGTPDGGSAAGPSGGAWQPGRYLVAGDLFTVADLTPDGNAYLTEQPFVTTRDAYLVQGDEVTFTGESCGGATGRYRWSNDARLHLSVIDDPCAGRSALLALPLQLQPEQLPYLVTTASQVLDQPDYNFATLDAAGHFYTTDGLSGFYEYAADGTRLRAWPKALPYTTGITVTDDGTIYVANFDDATIHAFDAAGTPVRSWQVDGGTIGPVGLAHDAKGNVYVALHRAHDHYIEKYSPKGRLLGTWARRDPAYGVVSVNPGPSGIGVTPDGTSYLGDPAGNRVLKFAPDGTFVASLTGDGTHKLVGPAILSADAKGNVFVMSMRTLWEFDATGAVVGRWFSPYDCSVAVDADGNVWLIDRQVIRVQLPGA